MNRDAHVFGNLALAPDSAPRLSVVQGGAHRNLLVSGSRQVFAPSVYASSHAPQGTVSLARSIVLILMSAAVACSFAAAFIGTFADHTYRDALESAPSHTVEVVDGDSLWDIAQRNAAKGLDTEETVRLIREWNDLDSGLLTPGMELVVPGDTD